MSDERLSGELTQRILTFLGVTAVAPSVAFLDRLIHAYARSVPWESAFRIVRRAEVGEPADCPRWPAQFWQQAMTRGAGGTCFESNYAYFALLRSLGFKGYLTINNMGETVGCHSAIVVRLGGQKWLVDAGFPIYVTLPISPHGVMHRPSPFLAYTVRPAGDGRYVVEQAPHPRRQAFTLIDSPVPVPDYRARTVADYGVDGLFLDRVIINKIIGDEAWRFNMGERPYCLNRFEWGQRFDTVLDGDPAAAVAGHFGMDETTVQTAFRLVDEEVKDR